MLLIISVCLTLAIASFSTNAQVVFQASRLRPMALNELQQDNQLLATNIPVFSLPSTIDNDELSKKADWRVQDTRQLRSGAYEFGKDYEVDIDTNSHGVWSSLSVVNDVSSKSSESRVLQWRMAVSSINAYSLSFVFSHFELPKGAELYLIALGSDEEQGGNQHQKQGGKSGGEKSKSDEEKVFGPYTSDNNKESKSFASWPISSNRIFIEYYAFDDGKQAKLKDKAPFKISKIIHGFRSLTQSKSGKCNIDVACDAAERWNEQVRSVALILTGSGTGFCTGAMINNAKRDGRQLFLTAHHCVGSSEVTDNLLMFNYQVSTCGATNTSSAPRHQTVHGLKKLAQWHTSDYSLLEVVETIPDSYNVYLAGWSALDTKVPSWAYGIHHPSVDIKKFSVVNTSLAQSCWGWCDADKDALDHWKVQQWTRGTTEPGSSGSPLFDGASGRIVGQLHGGAASCQNPTGYDLYGKLSYSFNKSDDITRSGVPRRLQYVLDPEDAGVVDMDGTELKSARGKLRRTTTTRVLRGALRRLVLQKLAL